MENFLSADDISDKLRIKKMTLNRMVKEGKFPSPYGFGDLSLWTSEDFDAWKIFFTKSSLPLPKLDENRLLEIKECAEKACQKVVRKGKKL